jgi:predicted dehydrogenase
VVALAVTVVLAILRRDTTPVGAVADGMRAVGGLVALESGTWILYYLVVRSIVERQFTIFHPAEYLVALPVVLVAQAVGLALVLALPVLDVAQALGGFPVSSGWTSALLVNLGRAYLVVGITVLLSSFPPLRVRDAEVIAIVGSGEVVRARILPALRKLGYRNRELVVLGIDSHQLKNLTDVETYCLEPTAIREWLVQECVPAVIATPPDTHFDYVAALADTGVKFAIEKPITLLSLERRFIEGSNQVTDRCFALSYYVLEKALPLTYLRTLHPMYRGYLVSDGGPLPQPAELQELQDDLGELREVTIEILEGVERSPAGDQRLWTEDTGRLITFGETAVHPLSILCHVLTSPDDLETDEVSVGVYEPRRIELAARSLVMTPSFLDLRGHSGATRVRMTVGKYIRPDLTHRGLKATYANGEISCDFDSRSLQMLSGRRNLHLAIQSGRANYEVMLDLFHRFVTHGWGIGRFDDLDVQLHALRIWDDICVYAIPSPVRPYADKEPPFLSSG